MQINHISRILLAGAVALTISTGVVAAPKNPGMPMAGQHKMMCNKLNLTDAQKAQIKSIREEAKAEAARIKSSNIPESEKKAQLKSLREGTKSKIEAVLTPDQRAQFAQMRKHHRDGMKRMVKALNLTPDQQAKAKVIDQNLRQEVKGIKTNSSLTDAQKKDQIKAARQKAKSDFKALLTPDQLAKFQQMQQRHSHKKA